MSGYQLFSQFYDNLTFNVDYSKRADYIQSVLSLYGHDWGLSLDLACGTGSLTVELKRRGVDIFGIDGSYDMLSQAMDKAYDEGLEMLFCVSRWRILTCTARSTPASVRLTA